MIDFLTHRNTRRVSPFPVHERLPGSTAITRLALALLIAVASGCAKGPRSPFNRKDPIVSPIFRDVASDAGISFRMGHNGRSPLTILEITGGGCGFMDYDGDGRLDIILVGNSVALYHNEGNGRFRDISGQSGLDATGSLMGCAVGDYDNDGRPDIFITGYGIERLYHNQGGGRFKDVTRQMGLVQHDSAQWATSAGYADLDGDGFLDLAVCHYVLFTKSSRQLCDYPPAVPGNSRVWASCPPFYYPPQRITVYRNLAGGRFDDVTQSFSHGHGNGLGLAFADYDSDGKMDLYVANDGLPADLYHNLGNWRFENLGTQSGTALNQDGGEQAGMGADWGDYDGDGRLDLVVTTFQNEPRSLYRNEGRDHFSYASFRSGIGSKTMSRLGFGGGFCDFDNDSFLDLLFANGHVQDTISKIHPPATYAQTMQLFHNRGDGTFDDWSESGGEPFAKPIVGRGAAFGDYDNDGKMDALIVDSEGAPMLLHNESHTSNHWLGLRLLNHGRDAIGARVTIELARGTRVAEPQTCRSYLAAGDARLHFGLGSERIVRRLTVRWPDGKINVMTDVDSDRYMTIKEEKAR